MSVYLDVHMKIHLNVRMIDHLYAHLNIDRNTYMNVAKLSFNSTQLNSTSTSIEAEIALFPVSDKPPTRPPTHLATLPPVEVVR